MDKLICECCNKNDAIGVACVPGVPYSAAYCRDCLKHNSHPMPVLVANTACCGGLEHCNAGWIDMVNSSLEHQNKTIEWFTEKVKASMEEKPNKKGES